MSDIEGELKDFDQAQLLTPPPPKDKKDAFYAKLAALDFPKLRATFESSPSMVDRLVSGASAASALLRLSACRTSCALHAVGTQAACVLSTVHPARTWMRQYSALSSWRLHA